MKCDDGGVGYEAPELLSLRLAHGWLLFCPREQFKQAVSEFLRPAVRAVPSGMAARLKACRITLAERMEKEQQTSRWTLSEGGIEVVLAAGGVEGHELAMELLLCLGQALREVSSPADRERWLRLLQAEIEAGVAGEIDEEALGAKRRLLLSPASARNPLRLERYARASFASTVAEYVHCLWHDVTVRSGPEHLPAGALRRRLEMMSRWFPPDRGYKLFAGRRKPQM